MSAERVGAEENHALVEEPVPGFFRPIVPVHPGGIDGWRVRRWCRSQGGHWWHVDPSDMIGWQCCNCGAEKDGYPEDGSPHPPMIPMIPLPAPKAES
jgi:hypothetical protein